MKSSWQLARAAVLGATVSLIACSAPMPTGDAGTCTPGQTAACTCDGGARGARSCSPSGTFGSCTCGGTDAASDAIGGVTPDAPIADVVSEMGITDSGDPCDMDGDNEQAASCGGGDCDDNDPERHHGAVERCGGTLPSGRSAADHDEDCNPCTVYNLDINGDGDADRDGYPSQQCTNPWRTSSRPIGCDAAAVNIDDTMHLVTGNDCNDDPAPVGDGGVATDASVDGGSALTGANIHPTNPEVCNGVDDNCNGEIDDGVGDRYYADCDGDLFGAIADPGQVACSSGALMPCNTHLPVRDHTDCDDVAPLAHPGGTETCDGADNDCDGTIDNHSAVSSCTPGSNQTAACVAGACAFSCSGGFGDCDRVAANGCETNLSNSTSNCGSCGNACGGGRLCVSSACACTGGTSPCGSSCVNLSTDTSNCGGCGNVCPAPSGGYPTCTSGACGRACSPPTVLCGGACQTPGGCSNGYPGLCAASGSYACGGGGAGPWYCNDPYVWPGTQTLASGSASGFGSTCSTNLVYGSGFSPPPTNPSPGCFYQYGPYSRLHAGHYRVTFNVQLTRNSPFSGGEVAFIFDVTRASGSSTLVSLGGGYPVTRVGTCHDTGLVTFCSFPVIFDVTSECQEGLEYRIRYDGTNIGGITAALYVIGIGNTVIEYI